MAQRPTSQITATQTIGPFPHEGWRWAIEATAGATKPAISITGVVYDGDGKPITDAVLEAWMPSAVGAEAERSIPGFRRVPTDEGGRFRLEVVAPQAGEPAAYITVFSRGLLQHQFTAVFLEEGAEPRASWLAAVPEARRATLIARKIAPSQYQWDVWMQTEKETVFFDFA